MSLGSSKRCFTESVRKHAHARVQRVPGPKRALLMSRVRLSFCPCTDPSMWIVLSSSVHQGLNSAEASSATLHRRLNIRTHNTHSSLTQVGSDTNVFSGSCLPWLQFGMRLSMFVGDHVLESVFAYPCETPHFIGTLSVCAPQRRRQSTDSMVRGRGRWVRMWNRFPTGHRTHSRRPDSEGGRAGCMQASLKNIVFPSGTFQGLTFLSGSMFLKVSGRPSLVSWVTRFTRMNLGNIGFYWLREASIEHFVVLWMPVPVVSSLWAHGGELVRCCWVSSGGVCLDERTWFFFVRWRISGVFTLVCLGHQVTCGLLSPPCVAFLGAIEAGVHARTDFIFVSTWEGIVTDTQFSTEKKPCPNNTSRRIGGNYALYDWLMSFLLLRASRCWWMRFKICGKWAWMKASSLTLSGGTWSSWKSGAKRESRHASRSWTTEIDVQMLKQDKSFDTKGSNSVAGSKDCASPEFGQSKYIGSDGEQDAHR